MRPCEYRITRVKLCASPADPSCTTEFNRCYCQAHFEQVMVNRALLFQIWDKKNNLKLMEVK